MVDRSPEIVWIRGSDAGITTTALIRSWKRQDGVPWVSILVRERCVESGILRISGLQRLNVLKWWDRWNAWSSRGCPDEAQDETMGTYAQDKLDQIWPGAANCRR